MKYGTAGIRDRSDRLHSAMVRIGMLASLQSIHSNGRPVGVVVTASHNTVEDNGAKVMDCRGEMLPLEWESFAERLVNAKEGDEMRMEMEKMVSTLSIDLSQLSNAKVFISGDTRPSTDELEEMVSKGVKVMKGVVYRMGKTTTPQLHWIIRNLNMSPNTFVPLHVTDRSDSDLEIYYTTLSSAFKRLYSGDADITIDCANGVGAIALCRLKSYVDSLRIHLINDSTTDSSALNRGVGAEFVQKNRTFPRGVNVSNDRGKSFASIDGDADRVVFFFVSQDESCHLLDGDKISALLAQFIQRLLVETDEISIGVVQTAYANGAASDFIANVLGIPLHCVATGVKHLHHKAAEFDVGIYFEANGHGTVLFSEKAQELFKSKRKESEAMETLYQLTQLVNQAVGDAISDILLVQVVLSQMGMSFQQWDQMYTDLPSYQSKVKVSNRNLVKTIDAERRVQSPEALQTAIDQCVVKFKSGRAFVRPSGTEDVVRVYAEAATEEEVRTLGNLMEKAIREFVQ